MKISEHRTQVYMPNSLNRALNQAARQEGVSVAQVIRQAVERYLGIGRSPRFPQHDPIDDIIGSLPPDGIRDAARRHDDYIWGDKP